MKIALWIIGSVLGIIVIMMIYNYWKRQQMISAVAPAVLPPVVTVTDPLVDANTSPAVA